MMIEEKFTEKPTEIVELSGTELDLVSAGVDSIPTFSLGLSGSAAGLGVFSSALYSTAQAGSASNAAGTSFAATSAGAGFGGILVA